MAGWLVSIVMLNRSKKKKVVMMKMVSALLDGPRPVLCDQMAKLFLSMRLSKTMKTCPIA